MQVLNCFLSHFGIRPEKPQLQLLNEVASAFSTLPFENITKIIKLAECGNAEKARRSPGEAIESHIAWGAGGTCFSLTSTPMYLVRSLGWEVEYLLADRPYGHDTHCALLLWIDGKPHLLDTGYLVVRPVPISRELRQKN